MHLDIVITFIISSFILTISPGPDIIYVISQSFLKGRKAAIITSIGLTTGLLLHTFFVVIGLSLLLRDNENIFFLLKFIGSIYFLYLAFMSFLNRNKKIKFHSYEIKNITFFKKGLLMNLLNPKVSLFFIALFPGFLFHNDLSSEFQFLILGIIFWFQANVVFILVSLFSQKIKNFFSTKKILTNKQYIIEICIYIFISIWILK
ncbi:MAG: hypothetical protein CMC38_04920 [Flavobacteriaceae bacterium]|nr:hypothetical protein [Flavobacteriaceae bacterium]|tara:strand:+ start:2731 stop:3342 length:612 start_codon:yes stop_codon:yes gene_type:complete